MSKYDFERVVAGVEYKVRGEVLPSGKAVFTFALPLPARTPVVSVHEDIVMDIVKDAIVTVSYNHETEEMVLGLECLTEVKPADDDPEVMVGQQGIDAEEVLDIILDFVVTPCDNCGGFHFGEDVMPEPVKALPPATKKKSPTYLN